MSSTPTMPVPWRLIPATLVDRPNRFLTNIIVQGEQHQAHLPDPGRLKELLLPGVDLLVQHNPGPGRSHGRSPSRSHVRGPGRKTDYTVHLARRPNGEGWVCINTLLPNRFVRFLLNEHQLPALAGISATLQQSAVAGLGVAGGNAYGEPGSRKKIFPALELETRN